MESERKLRVGIIGTGVGIRTHLPGFLATGRANVVGISGSTPLRAQKAARAHHIPLAYTSYQELCADPTLDLICVGSPNNFHFEHYQAAAASGKHILLEKPAANTAEELQQFLIMPATSAQIVLVVHQLRFNPYILALRQAIRSGELGQVYHLTIHQQGTNFFPSQIPHSWSFDASQGGGVRLAMGSHLVDTARFLLESSAPSTVFGTTTTVHAEKISEAGDAYPVTASAAFTAMAQFGATTATLSASAAAKQNSFEISVLGTDGEAHFDLKNKVRLYTRMGNRELRHLPGISIEELENKKSLFRTSFVHLADAMTQAVLDGEQAAIADGCTLSDQLPTIQTLDAIKESAKTGQSASLA